MIVTQTAMVALRRRIASLKSLFGMLGSSGPTRGTDTTAEVGMAPFRSIIEHAGQIIYTVSPEGKFLYVSPAWTTMLGHDRAGVTGTSFKDYVHPDDIPAYWGALTGALGPAHPMVTVDYRVRHLDGSWRWHHTVGAHMPSGGEGPDSFVGIARDITEERRTRDRLERTLRETRERFEVSRVLLDKDSENEVLDALIGVAEIHPGGFVVLWSYEGEAPHQNVVKKREGRLESGMERALRVGARLDISKYIMVDTHIRDGVFWTNDMAHDPRVDPDLLEILGRVQIRSFGVFVMEVGGQRYGLITVVSTAAGWFDEEKLLLFRSLAEQGGSAIRSARLWEATRASQQRLSLVMSQSPLPIIEWDREFRVVSWNPAAERVFGFRAAEVIGRSGLGLVIDPSERDTIFARMAAMARDPGPLEVVRRTLTKDRGRLTCRWLSSRILTDDGVFVGAVSVVEDITERARAEQDLRESETRYKALVEVTHEGVVIHRNGTIVEVNEAFARLHGMTRQEIIGRRLLDLIPERLHDLVTRMATSRTEQQYESETRKADGTIVPVRVMSAPAVIQGQTVRIATLWDLTEERKAQAVLKSALKLSRVRFLVTRALAGTETEQEVLEAMRTAVAFLPPSSCALFTLGGDPANPTVLWRWSTGTAGVPDPLPRSFTLASRPGFRLFLEEPGVRIADVTMDARVTQPVRETFLGAAARSAAAFPLRFGNEVLGSLLVTSNGDTVFDEETTLLFAALAEQGAVALRAASLRGKARASEENFRRVAENMRDLISEVDARGIYRYVSPSYRTALGYSPRALIGSSFLSRVHPDDLPRVGQTFETARETGQEFESEFRFLLADGTYRWLNTVSRPVFDADGIFAGAIRSARDVTERRKAEEEVRRLNAGLEKMVRERTAQLESANRELEAFSYSVSHDLRAPLRAIGGFSAIIAREWGDSLPPEAARYLQLVSDSTTRMSLLIDGLLSLSRLSRQPLHAETIDMNALVGEVVREIREQPEGTRVSFEIGGLPAVSADPVLVRQVWANLLSNAVKFSRSRPSPRVEVTAEESGDVTVYCVKDNGIGFDMRYADRLFGAFQRLHTSEEYEGTGIGLANVQRIVHRHRGRVWAEAGVDKGAAFFFTLQEGTVAGGDG